MKKLTVTLSMMLFTVVSFAQLGSQNNTISVNADYSDPKLIGLSYEFGLENFSAYKGYSSNILKVCATQMEYIDDGKGYAAKGMGYAVEFGSRGYSRRGFEGSYVEWLLSYGSTTFDDPKAGKEDDTAFTGTYSYLSFVNPSIGYKIVLGRLTIDPSIGFTWKIEIKGKGDVDNANVDTTSIKGGVKVGFCF